ncbi:hypothetical protein SCUP234_04128 [Seiridium cupressi]
MSTSKNPPPSGAAASPLITPINSPQTTKAVATTSLTSSTTPDNTVANASQPNENSTTNSKAKTATVEDDTSDSSIDQVAARSSETPPLVPPKVPLAAHIDDHQTTGVEAGFATVNPIGKVIHSHSRQPLTENRAIHLALAHNIPVPAVFLRLTSLILTRMFGLSRSTLSRVYASLVWILTVIAGSRSDTTLVTIPSPPHHDAMPTNTSSDATPVSNISTETTRAASERPAAYPQCPEVRIRAQRSSPRGVDLRVHWEDDTDYSGEPPIPAPPPPPPPTSPAAPETEQPDEPDPHSLPEIHHQQPNVSAGPALGPHNPANPAATPPNPGMYIPSSAIHIAAGAPTPVFVHQQPQMIIGQPSPMIIGHQSPVIIQQAPPTIISNQPYLLTRPPVVGPAIQAPPIVTGYPNWRQSPFHDGTSHWRTNPPIIIGQPGAQPVFLGGQSTNVIIYR